VLFFNTVQNKSSEWGVMPYHWYFSNALLKVKTLPDIWLPNCSAVGEYSCFVRISCSNIALLPALHPGTEPDHSVDSSRPLGIYLPERIAAEEHCCRSERFKGTVRVVILERGQYNVALLRRTGISLRDALQHPSPQGRLPVLCSARAPILFIAWSC
jgi:hypothetical protein